jgi:CDP-paratose 2-epimerase
VRPRGFDVIGIDKDLRAYFFGPDASVRWNAVQLTRELPRYRHVDIDIRSARDLESIFEAHGRDVALV